MKMVELSDEAHAALLRRAAAQNLPPAEVLTTLLRETQTPWAGDRLLFYLASTEFTTLSDPTARYLALLGWVARNNPGDFADFISHQESGRRYLMLNRDELNEVRAHNHAVQLADTHYWAVMLIDRTTKRRFVCRLLEFIGCHDETIAESCRALGLNEAPAVFRLLSA